MMGLRHKHGFGKTFSPKLLLAAKRCNQSSPQFNVDGRNMAASFELSVLTVDLKTKILV